MLRNHPNHRLPHRHPHYALALLATLLALHSAGPLVGAAEKTATSLPTTPANAPAALEPGFFPLLAWGAPISHRGLEHDRRYGLASLAECHFNVAGFVQPKALARCEELGLKAFVQFEPNPFRGRKWSTITDEQLETWVRDMIQAAGDSPAALGFYLVDEPGTTAFPALAKAVKLIRDQAPGKLAYINLFPGYATLGAPNRSQLEADSFAEYLERFVSEVNPQFISYDDYMVQYSQDLKDPKRSAVYYRDLLEVRRVARKHNLPFWNIVSSNQIRKFTTIPSSANLQFQAYTTLAAGGKGLSWYTYYAGNYGYAPIDATWRRTSTWACLQMVNRHVRTLGPLMAGLTSTGVFFTDPAPADEFPVLPGRLVRNVQAETPFMVGEFTGPDARNFVMVVNLSLEKSVRCVLDMQPGQRPLHAISAEDGLPQPLEEDTGLWLTAGQGALIEIGPAAPAQEVP